MFHFRDEIESKVKSTAKRFLGFPRNNELDNLGFLSRLAHLLGLQRVPLLHQKRYQSINISEHLTNFFNTDRTEVHALHARPLEQVDLERVEVTAEHHGG